MTGGTGLAILRIGLGLLLAGHGCQKLFGWFRGHGPAGTAAFFDQVGYRPGRQLAVLAGACELTAGALLALGLLTPLAAAVAVGTMLAAAAVHAANGLWAADSGFELPGCYAIVAAALGFTGPGRYSLDAALGLGWGWHYGVAALLVGLFAGSLAIAGRARQLRRAAPAATGGSTVSHGTPVPVQQRSTGSAASPYPRGGIRATFVSRRIIWH